jgi:hypothetical protein
LSQTENNSDTQDHTGITATPDNVPNDITDDNELIVSQPLPKADATIAGVDDDMSDATPHATEEDKATITTVDENIKLPCSPHSSKSNGFNGTTTYETGIHYENW